MQEQCTFVCEEVWNEEATRLFLPCSNPMRCFTEFWESNRLGDKPQVEASIYTKLQDECSFGAQPHLLLNAQIAYTFGSQTNAGPTVFVPARIKVTCELAWPSDFSRIGFTESYVTVR